MGESRGTALENFDQKDEIVLKVFSFLDDDGDGDDDCDDDDVWLVSGPSDGGSNWVESGTRVLEYSLHYIVVSTWEYILSSHYSQKTRIQR